MVGMFETGPPKITLEMFSRMGCIGERIIGGSVSTDGVGLRMEVLGEAICCWGSSRLVCGLHASKDWYSRLIAFKLVRCLSDRVTSTLVDICEPS